MKDREAELDEQVAMFHEADALLDRIIEEVRPVIERATATDQQ